VIDRLLPDTSIGLRPEWSLRNPNDYLEVFRKTVPAALKESGVYNSKNNLAADLIIII
jgi:L-ribulokinase